MMLNAYWYLNCLCSVGCNGLSCVDNLPKDNEGEGVQRPKGIASGV